MNRPQHDTRLWLAGIPVVSLVAVGVITFAPLLIRPSDPAASSTGERLAVSTVNEGPPVQFGRDVRPLLSDRCFQCHGPDAAQRMAGLRLDDRASALSAEAFVPGSPEHSELMHRITSDDPAVQMPPPDSAKSALTPDEQRTLARWIADGAEYESHWAFAAPVRPEVPSVSDESWCRNPIDRFILARLESDGLKPQPDADADTALRRMFLDLTGLPPTTAELDYGDDAGAQERWVDRIFAEEPYRSRYAERMTTPWLDQARYADTIGIHTDNGRQMWLWRDWVIEAYRSNMPFDQFLREQLAGDLMPDASVDQIVATGFNRNHVITDEGGAIPAEYLVEYAVDRTVTTGSVFLGLTLDCARCHDHKFDPIGQDEFYSLYAFFNSNQEPGLYSQSQNANRAYEPFLEVPTDEQNETLAELDARLVALQTELDAERPEDDAEYESFLGALTDAGGVQWHTPTVIGATSENGATMTILDDASVRATGENPDQDVHTITLRTNASELRVLMMEVLSDETLEGRIGRAPNGNAVLDALEVEVAPTDAPDDGRRVSFDWVWADHSQTNGNFHITNVLRADDRDGWAVDGHQRPGGRVAMLLADEPFGDARGSDIRITLRYNTVYAKHVLSQVRFRVGTIDEGVVARLPLEASRWAVAGPFPEPKSIEGDGDPLYDTVYGPEAADEVRFGATFGEDGPAWRFDGTLTDGAPVGLPAGRIAMFVGKTIYAPTDRTVNVSLGSDDGFAIFVNGTMITERRVNRGVAPDQDQAELPLIAGANTVVMKIINTGGPSGYYFKASPQGEELTDHLVGAVLPEAARDDELESRIKGAWRVKFLPRYREALAEVETVNAEIAATKAAVPLTMVMRELEEPRAAYVLDRGRYDAPDESRPVTRGVPAVLGRLSENVPQNRLGLALWMTDADNPLVSRVAVNRLWELCFGTGLVRTSEDFGIQGEWPSHPELLDWLAVEFRESGWDVQHILRLIVTSSTYRQRSTVLPDVLEHDPDHRLLASFPRRRLSAEQVRDMALFTSGLLVEQVGGPAVKPYQPEGLWREVAMLQSNTRNFERGGPEALWRRSLYTYWKRASPPPSMQIFDAPTREFCTIRRPLTSTPLQALVLWNDEQFVEAARMLALRTLEADADDEDRLRALIRRCTAREPDAAMIERAHDALEDFRERYRGSEEDASAMLSVGEAMVPEDVDRSELAAWTLVANAMLNLYETTTQH